MAVTQRWGTQDWSVMVFGNHVVIEWSTGSTEFRGLGAERLRVARRWFRWRLVVDGTGVYKGLAKDDALALAAGLERFVARQQKLHDEADRQERISSLRLELSPELDALGKWHSRVRGCFATAETDNRWITHDTVKALAGGKAISGRASKSQDEFRFRGTPHQR